VFFVSQWIVRSDKLLDKMMSIFKIHPTVIYLIYISDKFLEAASSKPYLPGKASTRADKLFLGRVTTLLKDNMPEPSNNAAIEP
jgi:hypothetical protein